MFLLLGGHTHYANSTKDLYSEDFHAFVTENVHEKLLSFGIRLLKQLKAPKELKENSLKYKELLTVSSYSHNFHLVLQYPLSQKTFQPKQKLWPNENLPMLDKHSKLLRKWYALTSKKIRYSSRTVLTWSSNNCPLPLQSFCRRQEGGNIGRKNIKKWKVFFSN
jgi:hypothetical protein